MKALTGVRILDLTQFEAGPACTQTLAWLGAEVIKVERPTGDPDRRAGQDIPGEDSAKFLVMNANKRSITLNLHAPKGQAMMRRLVEVSDVVVENFAPGTMERLGLSYEEVSAVNPRIIYGEIKGYDPSGPFGRFRSFDAIAEAVGGATSLTGEDGGIPITPGPNMADTGAGIHLAVGILGALYQRQTTGRGQRVAVNMQEVVINFCRTAFANQIASGEPSRRSGNRALSRTSKANNAPGNLYPTSPGGPNDYISIYTSRTNADHWPMLLKAMGREDLLGDPRYATLEARIERADEVDEIVASWTRQRGKREAMLLLGKAGIPAGAVFDTAELSTDPELRRSKAFVTLERKGRGSYTMPSSPIRLSDSPVEPVPAPMLGQDSAEIYAGLLGLGPEDLAALKAEGIL